MKGKKVTTLFANFLSEDSEYEACRIFWKDLVDNVAKKHGQVGDWLQWVPRTKADGATPLDKEFLTIYDGRSAPLDKAFRIKQHEPSDDFLDISAWTTTYEAEYEELPRQELFIALSLSEESATIAESLLDKWMKPETSAQEMQSFIEEEIG